MSIEIRRATEGHCECPGPHPRGYQWRCRHWYECDWGCFNNAEVDTRRPIEHLMLVARDYVEQLLASGPVPHFREAPAIASATTDGDRLFVHLDEHGGRRWTWELFDAHFQDGRSLDNIMVGRWPD